MEKCNAFARVTCSHMLHALEGVDMSVNMGTTKKYLHNSAKLYII